MWHTAKVELARQRGFFSEVRLNARFCRMVEIGDHSFFECQGAFALRVETSGMLGVTHAPIHPGASVAKESFQSTCDIDAVKVFLG